MNICSIIKKQILVLVTGAMAVALPITAVSRVTASPITLAFTAQVTEIDNTSGSQLSLPFTVSIGDEITGSFRFEPVLFGQSSVTNQLSLELFGYALEGTTASLITRDNQALTPWVDSIAISNDFEVLSTEIPNVDLRQLGLSISTSDNLIDAGEDLSNLEVWNRIPPLPGSVGIASERQVAFQLTLLSGLSPMTVFAELGNLRIVPEPCSLVFASTSVTFLILIRSHRELVKSST